MKRNSQKAKRRRRQIRVWTLGEARAAVPYLSSILRSVREYFLTAANCHLQAKRTLQPANAVERSTQAHLSLAAHDAAVADQRCREALDELRSLDIYPLEPLACRALIPFVKNDELAWYVFELFEAEPIASWYYHSDPPEVRRSLSELEENDSVAW